MFTQKVTLWKLCTSTLEREDFFQLCFHMSFWWFWLWKLQFLQWGSLSAETLMGHDTENTVLVSLIFMQWSTENI